PGFDALPQGRNRKDTGWSVGANEEAWLEFGGHGRLFRLTEGCEKAPGDAGPGWDCRRRGLAAALLCPHRKPAGEASRRGICGQCHRLSRGTAYPPAPDKSICALAGDHPAVRWRECPALGQCAAAFAHGSGPLPGGPSSRHLAPLLFTP